MLKSVLSGALALTLISGTVAYAAPYHGGYRDHGGWVEHQRYHRSDDTGAAVAVGVGLFALVAIMASQDRERERDAQYQRSHDGDYRDGPPPPPPRYDDRHGPSEDR